MNANPSYREELEEDFGSYVDRLLSIADPKSTMCQLKNVLAVQFALNAANDVVRRYRHRLRDMDELSPDWQGYTAAAPRINSAFSELLSAETRDYDEFKEMVFRALDHLVTPLSSELEIALTSGDTALRETTDDFATIQSFLNNHVFRD